MSACWAREDEIDGLIRPMRSEPRSATILYGDSGIGKSTVLDETRSRLLAFPRIHAGFHEASSADHDPLLAALDNLLEQVLVRDETLTGIRRSCAQLARGHPVPGLEEFLLIASRSSFHGALARFASVALVGFGRAPDEIRRVPDRIETLPLPVLSPQAFAGILTLLQLSLPDHAFVFVLDDFGAPVTAAAAGTPLWTSLQTIEAFIAQEYRAVRGVHFLFSWKLNEETRPQFERFERVLREYGGRLQELKQIVSRAALAEWLATEFAWFAALPPDDQSIVTDLTGGLPEVVVKWREADLASYDFERLETLAQDTRARRYLDLQRVLEAASTPEREAMYSLALVPHAMAAGALAELTEADSQQTFDAMRSWERRYLLRRLDVPEGPAYAFRHAQKAAVARECLPATFVDNGERLVQRAYAFFLGTFSLLARTPEHTNYCSPLHLMDALLLLSDRPSLDRESAGAPQLRALISIAVAWKLPEDAPPWQLPRAWPASLQAWWFELSLAAGYGQPNDVLAALDQWIAERHVLPRSPSQAFSEAAALASLAGRVDSRSRAIEGVLERLQSLQRARPVQVDMAVQRATGLLNVLIGQFEIGESARLIPRLKQMRNLHRSFPREGAIAELLASAVATVLAFQIDGGDGDGVEIDRLLDELRRLRTDFPARVAMLISLGKGIGNAIATWGIRQQLDAIPGLLAEAKQLLDQPGRPDALPENVAIALSNAIYSYAHAQRLDEAEALLAELAAMQTAFPDRLSIRVVRAMALAIVLALAGNLRRMASAQQQLDALIALEASSPRIEPVARWLAEGLENATIGIISAAGTNNVQQIPIIRGYLDRLRALHREYPHNDTITEHLAAGIAWAIGGHGNIRAPGLEALLDEARAMYAQQPEQWLASQLALALNHAMLALFNFNRHDETGPLRAEQLELARVFPGLTLGRTPTPPPFWRGPV